MSTKQEIVNLLTKTLEYYEKEIAEFRKLIQEKSISYALEWNTKDALFCEEMVRRLRWIKNIKDEQTYEDIVNGLKKQIGNLVGNLTNKPWEPNSTSSLQNIKNIVEANAIVEEIKIYANILNKYSDDKKITLNVFEFLF